jgi:tripartite-type tricarboxylate transporter receptor subunit TctC
MVKYFFAFIFTILSLPVTANPTFNNPIKIVVGFPAGGGTDLVARVVAEKLSISLSVPVVVQNLPGASGTMAGRHVAKSVADGTTLMLHTVTTHAMAPNIIKPTPYDSVLDFTHISYIGHVSLILAVKSDLPVTTVPELIEYSRKNSLTYGSSGIGSTENFSGEMFKQQTNASITHVPYKGGAPMLIDLVGGHISMTFGWYPTLIDHVKTNKLRALAVLSKNRLPGLPNVPTMKELGYDIVMPAWYGLSAPAGLSFEKTMLLNREIVTILEMDDVRNAISKTGGELSDGKITPEQFTKFINSENLKMRKLIKQINMTITQ